MSVEIKTVGYKFKVRTSSNNVFDIISMTDVGITKSNKIIRDFFDNFKILKGEKLGENLEKVRSPSDEGLPFEKKVEEHKKVKVARPHRESVKMIWGNVRDLLDEEFTVADYRKALDDAGYEHTPGSWEAVPGQQLTKLANAGRIEKIEGTKPLKYRKLIVPPSLSSREKEEHIKSLKAGEKVMMGTIK